ncbi:MAG: AMP-binding protein [Gammaproteobacteria bacterium]|nr:AMP-binding protein [Gammaproteobacteria bacterium]
MQDLAPADNLYSQFAARAQRFASRPAVQFRPRYRSVRWTYGDLANAAQNIAQALLEAGIARSDRVFLYGANSPHWVAAYFGILACGAVVVPLNPQSPAGALDRIRASAEPALLLTLAGFPWPAQSFTTLSVERIAGGDGRPARGLPGLRTEKAEPAVIVYTSGTTGDPKGVMLSHGNLLANVAGICQVIPLTETDHVITLVPLFHMYGQTTSMLYPLFQGSAVTYMQTPSSRAIREALLHTPATFLVAVPEFLQTVMSRLDSRLARVPGFLRPLLHRGIRARLSATLHTIISGGAPLDPVIENKWRALGYEVLQGYGLTETSPVLTTNRRSAHRAGSVGIPMPGVEIRIADDGEILARGPNVMSGYYRDTRRTEEVFSQGWFKTGDAGKVDEDGFLYVFGRRKYMILGPGGENVFPEDIEAELSKVDGVRDSAVVGEEQDGRTVIHAVLLCEGSDGERIVGSANANLAPYQRIMRWSLWPEPDFPRSATRKVRKEEVLRWLRSRELPVPDRRAGTTALIRLLADLTRQDAAHITDSTRIVADLALDSLQRIELVSLIEEILNVSIEESVITAATTVADLEALIEQRQGSAAVTTPYPRWSLSGWACALRPWAQAVLFQPWLKPLCRLRVTGAEHLDRIPGPVIFMPNHRSFLDAPVIVRALPQARRRRIGMAAATSVLYEKFRWAVPLVELAYNSYPFATESGENIKPCLEYTGRLIDDGWSILVFPEGAMNRGDLAMLPLKNGAGMLAVEMQVPIIPVAILGTEKVLPPDTLIPRGPAEVQVSFGAPVSIPPETGYVQATQIIERALHDRLAATE